MLTLRKAVGPTMTIPECDLSEPPLTQITQTRTSAPTSAATGCKYHTLSPNLLNELSLRLEARG